MPEYEYEIWAEKYRPLKLEDIAGQTHIMERLKKFISKKNIPHMLFAGPAGVGKCVCPDTPILDGDGNLLTIEEAYNKKIDGVMSLGTSGKIKRQKIAYFYKGFSKSICSLDTQFGAKIKVTPEHPFLKLEDGKLKWVEAKDIVKGDLLASPEILEIKKIKNHKLHIPKKFKKDGDFYFHSFNNKASCKIKIPKLDEKYYYWLGLLFGDGNVRSSGVRFYNNNRKMRNRFKKLSYEIFGRKIEILDLKQKNKCPYMEIRKATTIVKLLEENLTHRICGKKSDIIKVPKEIYTSKPEFAASFIRGLYETDGSFYNSSVEMASTSKDLLIGLRYILLFFGIISRIKKHRVLISGNNEIKKFKKIIKPHIKVPAIYYNGTTNIDILTVNKKDIQFLFENFGISYEEIGSDFFHILDRGVGSRQRVQKMYDKLTKIIRKRIMIGLEVLSILNNLNDFKIDYKKFIDILKDKKIRGRIEIIRSDRLKEYYDKKRIPGLKSYLSLLKRLSDIRMISETEYKNILDVLHIRDKVLPALKIFNISYNDIAKKVNFDAGTINYILNNEGLSLKGVNKLQILLKEIKSIVEERVLNKDCMFILEYIDFIRTAKIIWDRVKEKTSIDGCEVYDLNVHNVHNFIGGNSPLILHNTTASLCIAKELYGNSWNSNYMELNASDTRGIDVVRGQIKDFARIKPMGTNFKIICLDEADSLTTEAQHALRRTMEKYISTTRFILIANYSNKIIDPIQSRCAVFRFRPLSEQNVMNQLRKISSLEKLNIDEKAMKAIFTLSEGDLRRTINILQACATVEKITEEVVYEMQSLAKPESIKEMIELAIKGEFLQSREKLLGMLGQGIAGEDIIREVGKVIYDMQIPESKRINIVEKIGDFEFRIHQGGDPQIQLEALLAQFVVV